MSDIAEDRSPKDGQIVSPGTRSLGNIYLLSYSFNQDFSCFVCGTTAGFRVFTTSPVCEVRRREHSPALQHKPVAIAAMLFRTNIFGMAMPSDDPATGGLNKVQLWDERKGSFIGELRSKSAVTGIAMRRDIIAMVCEYAIYVYTCDKLSLILHLTTNANTQGLCVLAAESDTWILCCPGQSTGAVRLQFGQDDRATRVFSAHQTALAALALNASGSLVATASENGTVIKVFNTSEGQLLYELRKSTRPSVITCLAFRPDDRFLGVASSTSTVHIFKLDASTATDNFQDRGQGWSPVDGAAEEPSCAEVGAIEQIASKVQHAVTKVASRAAAETVSDVVMGVIPKYFNHLKTFARFRLPDVDVHGHAIVDARGKKSRILGPQLAFHKTEARFFVLHYSGVLYECTFRPDYDLSLGTQDCGFVNATTWFAVRPDFKIQGPTVNVQTVAGGAAEDDEGAEEWQLL